MPISPYITLYLPITPRVPGISIFINMKRIIFITSLFVASFSYSQTDVTDSVFAVVFEAMLQENRVLLDSVVQLRASLHQERARRNTDTTHTITDTTAATLRAQQELRDTRAWIDARAKQPAMIMRLDDELCYMDLTQWRVQRVSNKRMVVVKKRHISSTSISRRFELILLGRSTTYYKETP